MVITVWGGGGGWSIYSVYETRISFVSLKLQLTWIQFSTSTSHNYDGLAVISCDILWLLSW